MKQVLIKKGQASVEEIPAPVVEPGRVLVQVQYSCISIGTEMSGIKSSGMPLWKRALKEPDKLKKVVDMAFSQGISHTRNVIEGKLVSGNPTGYSAAGVVIDVGSGVNDIQKGDKVACAGAQYANHAENICVPRNLVVRVPDAIGVKEASTVTLGAIALQGVRRAMPTLGETFVVIGLGILGQLTVQFLRANGCRVIGTDLDRSRLTLAESLGMDIGIHPDDGADIERVKLLTDGYGADGVIITAASLSHEILSTAFSMCRRKGRVVLVGDVGLHLNRSDFYQKELDFFISTSYGPGRYDNFYEEKGLDYPVAYVRWTENRNMSEYLRLLSEGKVRLGSLIQEIYPVEKADEAYSKLKTDSAKPLMVLIEYPAEPPKDIIRTVYNQLAKPSKSLKIRVAVAGAGSFAKGMHLPNMKALRHLFHFQAVMSRSGHNAAGVAKQFGAHYATTDYEKVLEDPEVDIIIISTRHNLHASMALSALRAGKHVLLEKPLVINREELEDFMNYMNEHSSKEGTPVLLTGYNRRFSKYAQKIKELTKNRTNSMIMNYRMNAGYIPPDHWVHNEEGGGRNIGEGCHIYDLFTFLADSKVVDIHASSISPSNNRFSRKDNFIATMKFEDGSLATLTYTALGSKEYPKELMEIYFDGKVIVLEDYKKLTVTGASSSLLETPSSEKGQKEELEALGVAIKEGKEWPIPFWQQAQAMEIAFAVEEMI